MSNSKILSRLLMAQLVAVAVLIVVALCVAESAFITVVWTALACVVPNLVFVRVLQQVWHEPKKLSVVFVVGQTIKMVVTAVLLALFAVLYSAMHWFFFVLTAVVVLKTSWVVLAINNLRLNKS